MLRCAGILPLRTLLVGLSATTLIDKLRFAFVIEPGMKGTPEVVETVRKYFVFA